MKHKIIITESQYKKLLRSVNEQLSKNFSPQLSFGRKAAPWLSAIFGNKQDGYTIYLPQSIKTEEVNSLISDDEVKELNKSGYGQRLAYQLGERNGSHFMGTMRQINPKYRALIIKTYQMLIESGVKNPKLKFERTENTTKTKPTGEPGGEIPFTKKFPVKDDLKSEKYFVDNSWELDEQFKKKFRETTLQNIKDGLSSTPNGQAVLNGITVRTSCSTLPNGKSPDGKVYTFAELSKLRNKSAKDFVLKELQSIGVIISPKLTYDDDWEGGLTGKYLGASSNSGNIWGQPGASKNTDDYEVDKYLEIALDGVISGKRKIPIDPTKEDGTKNVSYDYVAAFYVPDIPRTIPTIDLAWVWNPKTQSKCKLGEPNTQMKCETWGEGPKDWSTNMKGKIHWGTED